MNKGNLNSSQLIIVADKSKLNLNFYLIIFCVTFTIISTIDSLAQNPQYYYQFETGSSTSSAPSSICNPCQLSLPNSGVSFTTNTPLAGNCMELDIPNGKIKAPTFTPVSNASGLTVEMAFKFGSEFNIQRQPTFFSFGIGNSVKHYGWISYNKIKFVVYNSSNSLNQTLEIELDKMGAQSFNYYMDNNWHHIAFVYDGSTSLHYMRVYIDGILHGDYDDASQIFLGSDFQYSDPQLVNNNVMKDIDEMYFSSSLSNTYDHLFGDVDEIAVFFEPRNANQIYQDFLDVINNHIHYSFGSSTSIPGIDVDEPKL